MPWKAFQIDDEYCVFKIDENDNRVGDSLGCHATRDEANAQIAALNIAEEERMNDMDEKAQTLFEVFWSGIKRLAGIVERRIKDVDSWDGSASRWPSTADYCDDCLINLNTGDREDWTQANCKLPIREPGDGSDTFVRQAVFAAAVRIGQVDAPQSEIRKAARKLVSAYREMDEDPPESLVELTRAMSMGRIHQAIWQQLLANDREMRQDNYLVDLYADGGGLYALVMDTGHLYRYEVGVSDDAISLGERVQVTEEHPPVMGRTSTEILRQQDGSIRWLSVSATAVLNRVGEIDSRALFDSFIAHAEETGDYPLRMFYHCGSAFRTGQADYLARDGSVYITSGVYDDSELARREIAALEREPGYWGESIGYVPTAEPEMVSIGDYQIPVYHKGINREISTLPEREAANLFTLPVVIRTEVQTMALSGKSWEAFLKLFEDDEEAARSWLEANADGLNRSIEEAGFITRDGEKETPEEEPQNVREYTVDDEVIEVVVSRLAQAPVFVELKEEIGKLSELSGDVRSLRKRLEEAELAMDERLIKLERAETDKRREWQDDLPPARIVYGHYDPAKLRGEQETVKSASDVSAGNNPLGY